MPENPKGFSHIQSVGLTDVGKKRKNNEDSFLDLKEQGIYVVADGLGGAQAGEYASGAITDKIEETFKGQAFEGEFETFTKRCQTLRSSLNKVSQQIKEQGMLEGFTGTASTVVLLLLDPELQNRGSVFHAGDSRTYLYRNGTLKQVTTDHSFLTAAGVKDAKKLPKRLRNMVTRVVGVQDEVPIEETAVQVKPGDLYLLCSDGLTNMVPDTLLKKLFKKHEDDDLKVLADAFLGTALDAGGDDNITVLLVKIADTPAPSGGVSVAEAVEDTVVIGKWRGEKAESSMLNQSGPLLLLMLVGGLILIYLLIKLLF